MFRLHLINIGIQTTNNICSVQPVSAAGAELVLEARLRVVDTSGKTARSEAAHLYVDRTVACSSLCIISRCDSISSESRDLCKNCSDVLNFFTDQ